MAKFLFLYRGPATPMDQFTPDQQAEQMAAWTTWIEKTGSALTEVGTPLGARTAVRDDGGSAQPGDLNGWSILEAESLDAALAFTDGHPFLSEGKGRFAIDVFECVPM